MISDARRMFSCNKTVFFLPQEYFSCNKKSLLTARKKFLRQEKNFCSKKKNVSSLYQENIYLTENISEGGL